MSDDLTKYLAESMDRARDKWVAELDAAIRVLDADRIVTGTDHARVIEKALTERALYVPVEETVDHTEGADPARFALGPDELT